MSENESSDPTDKNRQLAERNRKGENRPESQPSPSQTPFSGDKTTIRFRKAVHAWSETSTSDVTAANDIRERYALRVAGPPTSRRSMFRRLMVTMLAVLAIYGALTQLVTYLLVANVLEESYQQQADASLSALEDSLSGRFERNQPAEQIQAYLSERYKPFERISIGVYDLKGDLIANSTGALRTPPNRLAESTRKRALSGERRRTADGLGFVAVSPIEVSPAQTGKKSVQGFLLIAAQPSTADSVRFIRESSWIWVVPVFLLSVLTAFLGTRSITQRLRQAEEVVSRVAAGDMQARIPLGEMDELGRVALTFNRTVDLLERTLHDLEQTDSTRRRMVADFAHDFNTPLTNVLAYLESLMIGDEDGSMDAATRHTFLQVAHDEAGRLAHLARDLETLTKLEAGRLVMERELVDLSLVAVDLARRVIPRAEAAGLEVLTDIEPGGEVIGDRMRLEQVGMNLLENSLRYTRTGSITIRIRTDDGSVTLSVIDTGIGIPPADLEKVSERFYRVDSSRTRATGGSGLGLAIVGRIVQRHGGRIEIESALDEGTTVSVWLPREGPLSHTVAP